MTEASCYVASNNRINELSTFGACGPTNSSSPFVSCCAQGHTCLDDGFCQYANFQSTGTGIYVGGCTDPTFKDPSCHGYCESLPESEVIYLNGTWQCCGMLDGAPTCNKPAGPSFAGPAPSDLVKVAAIVGTSPPTGYSTYPADVAAVTGAAQVDPSPASNSATITSAPSSTPSATQSTNSSGSAGHASLPSATSPSWSVGSTTQSQGLIVGTVLGSLFGIFIITCGIFLLARRKPTTRNGTAESRSRGPGPGGDSGGISSCEKGQHATNPSDIPPSYASGQHWKQVGELVGSPTGYGVRPPSPPDALPMQQRQHHSRPPVELMANARLSDRMAGGGPDKALPPLPDEARLYFNSPTTTGNPMMRQESTSERYLGLMSP